jgi:hypothetical protein
MRFTRQNAIQAAKHLGGIIGVDGHGLATLIMEEMSAAGMPCPETSATRMPRWWLPERTNW